jgi:uncharacterized protein (TIGR03067 family)
MISSRSVGAEPASDALDGEWQIIGMVYKGKIQQTKDNNFGTMQIAGSTLRRLPPNKSGWQEYEITLRPEKEPKEINFRFDGSEMRGIYKIENGFLTLVHPTPTRGEQPKTFDATTDATLVSFTLRRIGDAPKFEPNVPRPSTSSPSPGLLVAGSPKPGPEGPVKPAEVKPAPKASDEVAKVKPSGELGPVQVADVIALLRLDESSLTYVDEPPGKLQALRGTTTLPGSKTKVVVTIKVVYTVDLMSPKRQWDIKNVREARVTDVVFEKPKNE